MVAEHRRELPFVKVAGMSVAAFRAVSAVASQLVASLDEYEEAAVQLGDADPDSGLYVRVADCMDKIQCYSSSLPALSVPAVSLLIAHAEFVYALWHRSRAGSSSGRDLVPIEQEHRACIDGLRRACKRVMCPER